MLKIHIRAQYKFPPSISVPELIRLRSEDSKDNLPKKSSRSHSLTGHRTQDTENSRRVAELMTDLQNFKAVGLIFCHQAWVVNNPQKCPVIEWSI